MEEHDNNKDEEQSSQTVHEKSESLKAEKDKI